MACMLGARRLQHECERMVLQNAAMLRETGAFAACGAKPRELLQRLLLNVLRRHAAHARGCAELDFYNELDLWETACNGNEAGAPRAARAPARRCGNASASDSSTSESASDESDVEDDARRE